jgi:hypothetical protein
MTSPVLVVRVAESQWEVRVNDSNQTLLGTFYDTGSRDLFVEAVTGLVSPSSELESSIAA